MAPVVRGDAVRRSGIVETEPQRGWVAAKGQIDSLADQGLGLTLEQRLGSQGGCVARSARPAAGGCRNGPSQKS